MARTLSVPHINRVPMVLSSVLHVSQLVQASSSESEELSIVSDMVIERGYLSSARDLHRRR